MTGPEKTNAPAWGGWSATYAKPWFFRTVSSLLIKEPL